MRNNRILYLDVVKAIAICLVCIGHVPILVTMPHQSILHDWIYSFHMPLFMLLSGYFSAHALKMPFTTFLKKKVLQLIVPALVVSALRDLLSLVLTKGNVSHYDLLMNMVVGLWFLKTLFACYLYVWVVKHLHFSDYGLCLVSVTLALFFPHAYTLQFSWLLPFFWTGYFMKKHQGVFLRYSLPLFALSTAYFIFFGRHTSPEVLTYGVLFGHTNVAVWQFVTALCGSLMVILGGRYAVSLIKSAVWQHIAAIGMQTLGIYAVQTMIIEVLLRQLVHFNLTMFPFWLSDIILTPLLGIMAMLLCYMLVVLLSRFGWARVLILGMLRKIR